MCSKDILLLDVLSHPLSSHSLKPLRFKCIPKWITEVLMIYISDLIFQKSHHYILLYLAIKQDIETIVMIDIHYRPNIMSIIDNNMLLYYKLKAVSYAIIEMPVNTTATI